MGLDSLLNDLVEILSEEGLGSGEMLRGSRGYCQCSMKFRRKKEVRTGVIQGRGSVWVGDELVKWKRSREWVICSLRAIVRNDMS